MVLTILSGIWLTLEVTALSLVFGAVLGLPVTLGRRSSIRLVRVAAAAYVDVVRSIPPITWLFLIYFGLPQYALRLDSLTSAVVGFSILASAFFAEIYRSGLLGIDRANGKPPRRSDCHHSTRSGTSSPRRH
jgi:polar amino acid transport system permease protein